MPATESNLEKGNLFLYNSVLYDIFSFFVPKKTTKQSPLLPLLFLRIKDRRSKLSVERAIERVKIGVLEHLLGADALGRVVHHRAGKQIQTGGVQRRHLLLQRTRIPMRKRCLEERKQN